jgi:hypothetical protein
MLMIIFYSSSRPIIFFLKCIVNSFVVFPGANSAANDPHTLFAPHSSVKKEAYLTLPFPNFQKKLHGVAAHARHTAVPICIRQEAPVQRMAPVFEAKFTLCLPRLLEDAVLQYIYKLMNS